jgi:predicted P-loop ATPase
MADRIFDGDAELHGEAQRERAIFTNEKHVSDAWRQKLILTERHTPRGILANAITALREAPAWQSTIRFNDFTERAVIRGCPPWEAKRIEHDWTTADDIRTAEWLQHVGITVSPDTAAQAVEVVSRERRFHPVRDYLEQLCWDGIPRLDCWMIAFLSAEDTPYVRAISSRFSISAVARIYQPGCKADAVLILEGHQGTFKSTAIATLAEPWYTDEIDALGTKDASLQLAGVWLIELDELASMTRGEVLAISAMKPAPGASGQSAAGRSIPKGLLSLAIKSGRRRESDTSRVLLGGWTLANSTTTPRRNKTNATKLTPGNS